MGVFKRKRKKPDVPGTSRDVWEALCRESPTIRDLLRAVADAQDDTAHAHGRINKLQGRLTGGERKKKLDEQGNGPQIEPEIDINERIRQGLPLGG